ncbi:MAG: Sir2 silent information regulator family NAD-dependent deacetylase [Lachnospiraceae bacterium]|nr:Sir2 silent information regulator family NAD-dependent deacetylase [Lachnospiraceae bacterium]
MFSKIWTKKSTADYSESIGRLKKAVKEADAVVVGAGAGLSASAGLTYSGERFEKYFGDFMEKYRIRDMYSGGFYPYPSLEEYWAWWSRHIYYNRYVDPPKQTYQKLLETVKDKDYFVLTTNVDHCFQKAGFDKKRLFYTQGDYGLWQCSKACHQKTYDNEEAVRKMLEEEKDMRVPSALVPRCPVCGKPMTMNLRCDDIFVQDEGWYAARNRYADFLRRHEGMKVIYLELGVGANTPVIIKYPFWKMTAQNPEAKYICINAQEAYAPREILDSALCIEYDIDKVLNDIGVKSEC